MSGKGGRCSPGMAFSSGKIDRIFSSRFIVSSVKIEYMGLQLSASVPEEHACVIETQNTDTGYLLKKKFKILNYCGSA